MSARLLLAVGAAVASASDATSWRTAFEGRYDAVVLGTGLKESLVAGVLATRGKRVLQLDRNAAYGGTAASLDLNELFARMSETGEAPNEGKLGAAEDYRIDVVPKVLMANGQELQLVVQSGAWKNMDFKRLQNSLIYRRSEVGKPDVHRVLATVEDVLKTRMLTAMQKAAMTRLFRWIETYKEDDPATWSVGLVPLMKSKKLDVRKMSAAAFLRQWEVTPEMLQILVRGMALHEGPMKQLKKLPATWLLHKLKKYKDAYKTFPHMTSPYVYPSGGLGAELPKAIANVVEEAGGATLLGRPIDRVLYDEQGRACGVVSEGVEVRADCVVAAPEYVGPALAPPAYRVVRLYALLSHAPKLCKETRSCQLLLPAEAAGRKSDVYMVAGSSGLKLAPEGRWVVCVSGRVEGATDGLSALQVAKRELASVLPLLKPASKLFAELSDVCEAADDGEASRLFVPSSCDETSHMASTAADVDAILQRITGEGLDVN